MKRMSDRMYDISMFLAMVGYVILLVLGVGALGIAFWLLFRMTFQGQ